MWTAAVPRRVGRGSAPCDIREHVLPPHALHWLSSALPGPLPQERRATCDRCVMCEPPTQRYRPDIKCCSYLPDLPNFLVGAQLADARAEPVALASIRRRIAAGAGVTPLGLGRTRLFDSIYDPSESFGRAPGLLCPHFVAHDMSCGVWRYRNGVCATWFCRHDRGVVGLRLWESVRSLLTLVEESLATYALLEVGFEGPELAALAAWRATRGPPAAEELGGAPDPARLATWGAWSGKEEALYRACAAAVYPLPWAEVLRIGGAPVAAAHRVACFRWRELVYRELPAVLLGAPVEVLSRSAEAVVLVAYSPSDPVEVAPRVYDAIHALVGPTASLFDRFEAATGESLPKDTLWRLIDAGVLVAEDG